MATIDVSKPILDRNERLAAENRELFDAPACSFST
jgi:hypothetical protein